MSTTSTIFKTCVLAHCFLISVGYTKVTNTVGHHATTHCEIFNKEPCTNSTNCPKDDKCNEAEGVWGCFALWTVEGNSTVHLNMKGCFLSNQDCYLQEKCVARVEATTTIMFCCCEGNYCNKEFSWEIVPTTAKPLTEVDPRNDESSTNVIIYIVLGMVCVCSIVGFAGYYIYYRKRRSSFNEVPIEDPSFGPSDTPCQGLLPVQLLEIKARGRFGAVWKAMHKTEEVAVKVFPAQDKQSWMTEQEIFKIAQMEHPNILHFIAAEKRGGLDNMQLEYWLITAYHERGSLCDFLKAHTLTWTELCRVVETMARGLMHLHEELPPKHGHKGKPSIAHRDFKSKNVLLKNDLTACIADFGLALMFEPGKSCGDTHGQVGTRRYMAPEVLEGAINFTPDAFLRIDMYACGLVLWELVSRCTAQEGLVHEYRLPFEEEVGLHPTLEDMQESVVQRKVRPTIQNAWRNHSGLCSLCDTMEECWDHDAEARLSASCVMERVMLQGRYQNCNALSMRIENDALLINGKESSM